MRLEKPRVEPLSDDQIDPELKVQMGGRVLNIFRTLAHHPKLMKRWLVFGNHILAKSSLSPRDREIAILDLTSRRYQPLVRGLMGRYSPTGHVIYARSDGTLMALPFDLKTLRETGPAHQKAQSRSRMTVPSRP